MDVYKYTLYVRRSLHTGLSRMFMLQSKCKQLFINNELEYEKKNRVFCLLEYRSSFLFKILFICCGKTCLYARKSNWINIRHLSLIASE